jgi:hypothetical protein
MNASESKVAGNPQHPVFPQTLHRLRPNPAAPANEDAQSQKAQKRDNIFSKSRDTRENRGTRQIKTAHDSQTISHGR